MNILTIPADNSSCPSLLHPIGHLVANALDGEEVLGLAGILLDLLANLAHEHGDVVRGLAPVVGFAPDVLLDLPAREHLAGMRGQKRHDLEFLGGKRHNTALHAHLVLAEPHLQVADARHALAIVRSREVDRVLMSPDVGLDAQQQFGGIERLGDVIVPARAKPDALVNDVAFRRKEDDGDAPPLLADASA